MDKERPLLIVVSAPSGAGKTTLCDRLLAEFKDMAYSISCTTRAPRPGERDGKDYHFLSEQEFRARIERGEFLEHAVVHDHLYGTLEKTVRDAMQAGKDIVMDIDVQGARQIRERLVMLPAADPIRAGFLDIFVLPPSMETLRDRLLRRAQDSDAVIATRLENARSEMRARDEYRYQLVNDQLETAFAELRGIIDAAHGSGNSQ